MQRTLNTTHRAPLVVSRNHMRCQNVAAPQRAHFVSCKVASLDNVSAQMEQDDSFDKDAAYRRFEELLGTADVSFNQGDKVRGCCYP